MHGGTYEGPDGDDLHGDGREVGEPMAAIEPNAEQWDWVKARIRGDEEELLPIAQALADREASQVGTILELILYTKHWADCAQDTESARKIACSCGLTQLRNRVRAALQTKPEGTE